MRRVALPTTLVLLALSSACILAGLGRLPALSLDEAWTGLYALRLSTQGFYTPHEMNTYTGPLYGLFLSWILPTWGVDVASLRLPGALANVLALFVVAWNIRRRIGPEAAAWWGVLVAASAYLLLKSRLAWDVYALQPLLIAITLSLLDRTASWPRAFLLMTVTLLGVQNHFIYLSVPVSLVVLFAVRAAWLKEEGLGNDLRLCLSALAAGAVVFAVKPHLSETSWTQQRLWATPLFLSLVPLTASAAVAGTWERPLVALLSRPQVRLWGQRLLGLGLLASLVWHVPPLWEALAGPVLWKRMVSWQAPWWLSLALHLWSLFLLAAILWRTVRAWNGHESLSEHERTIALWPAAYLSVFGIFRNTSSLRYYSPVQFLGLAALACALARLPKDDRRPVALAAVFALIASQAVFWRELSSVPNRRPLQFRVGWRAENSWDFARKEALFTAFDDSKACAIGHMERSFVAIPLAFHRAATPQATCDSRLVFDADHCRDCKTAPFHRWSTLAR